ncbi:MULTISPECIES: glycosyl hydrolase 53 family protein [unclassified Paenibacillus]|uniref:glycosyl hydrolase 53 family protein n=1 Tax=unclassified Paenibacillus TaxID=185978 RepID=UPI002404BB5E|nr:MULTISPECIES: glycosyl hydrolase 53 family protein [unclassified Paenibacillus]MDF9842622.1 arabinogalactan endo-1,4-beta-galactosidase [Paenibacillus sp. PastF-2]MDF9849171.1 arabinogalactan endo-1,4-beta-galactosidase [Paenibacillus sp. PastM-2]MDF9855783.1 arabinogalactan endo-1,4-beta-galactosidase [Paenibacillus sp. PastF-1]MDH6481013.1 arabinogalactan endo-1,4-beta-galactosidase [Paenibacillus sp. PastH-2]MDH6508474.1 arabinogalactan endo-1,4-beta-galactosidase [Paenibacillus sp. Past
MKNRKRVLAIILFISMMLSTVFTGLPAKAEASAAPGSFAKGADISWLPQLEALGYKFYNDNGEEQDLLYILKDHGIDSIRIRAWVNPSDDPSNGHNSTEEVVALASRVSALGFRVMIDFHYSDSWADPGKQVTPAAWADADLEQLKVHVSEYTTDVMKALQEAGVTPEWVQIGNEINNGMLHPLGSYSNISNLVQLIQAGSSAAKAVFPDIKVIIHRANGAEAGVDPFYAGLVAAGLKDSDYDIIGLSYYPEATFTSSIDELSENMNKLEQNYGKEVMIVEVGGNVSEDVDSVHNMLVAAQNKLHAVPNQKGTGIFYWEPTGIMFDYPLSAWNKDGSPTIAMDAFIDGAAEINRYPVQSLTLDQPETVIEVGGNGKLSAILSPENATYKGVKFTSSEPDVVKVDLYKGTLSGISPGTATVTAVTYDGGFTATSEVTVIPSTSLVQNPGFEDGLASWTLTGDESAVTIDKDVYSGSSALHYYSPTPAEFTVSQTITGLENGVYTLSAWVSGGGGEEISEIFAGDAVQSFTNTGWQKWSKPVINDIEVTDGTLTVGAHYKLSDGQWGNLDHFELKEKDNTEYITVINPGFENVKEDGTPEGWTIPDTTPLTAGTGYTGEKSLGFWKASAFTFEAYQELTGLTDGTYTLSAWSQGAGDEVKNQLYAVSGDQAPLTASFANKGWNKWNKAVVENIKVTGGTLKIGVSLDAKAGDWGSYDDFVLIKNSEEPDTDPGTEVPPTEPGTDPGTEVPPTEPGTDPGTEVPPTDPGTDPGTQVPPTESVNPSPGSIPGSIPGDNSTPAVSNTPATEPTTSVIDNTMVYSVIIKTAADTVKGVSTAKLDTSVISGLLQKVKQSEAAGQSAAVEIKLDSAANVQAVQLSVPKEALKLLADGTTADLKVEAELGAITFDHKSVTAMGSAAADSEISITQLAASGLPENVRSVIGDRAVYDFSVKAGNAEITQFNGGKVKISLPYTPHTGEQTNAIVAYYIDPAGSLKPVRGGYDVSTGRVNLLTTHLSQYAAGYNEVKFSDVSSGHWYSDAVGYMAARGIVNGTGGNVFAPESKVTRADFLMMIMNAYGIEADSAVTGNFADAGNTYYSGYVGTAKQLGLVSGTGDNRFKPEAVISRQDMSVIFYNILKHLGELPSGKTGQSYGNFADTAAVSGYAAEAMRALVEAGVITGDGIKLAPMANTTRAQAVQVIYNAIK